MRNTICFKMLFNIFNSVSQICEWPIFTYLLISAGLCLERRVSSDTECVCGLTATARSIVHNLQNITCVCVCVCVCFLQTCLTLYN